MPSLDTILNALVTLFVTIDPLGNVPFFLVLTSDMTSHDRRSVAVRGVAIAFIILALFAMTGMRILDVMGITIDAFRVAGGLFLFYMAFEMLYIECKAQVPKTTLKERVANLAVFPLAIPLLAGPGTISATIILSSQLSGTAGPGNWVGTAILLGVIFSLLALTCVVLMAAEIFDKYLGSSGKMVLTCLLGVLLAALSVQYVTDGVKALFAP